MTNHSPYILIENVYSGYSIKKSLAFGFAFSGSNWPFPGSGLDSKTQLKGTLVLLWWHLHVSLLPSKVLQLGIGLGINKICQH